MTTSNRLSPATASLRRSMPPILNHPSTSATGKGVRLACSMRGIDNDSEREDASATRRRLSAELLGRARRQLRPRSIGYPGYPDRNRCRKVIALFISSTLSAEFLADALFRADSRRSAPPRQAGKVEYRGPCRVSHEHGLTAERSFHPLANTGLKGRKGISRRIPH
jgi:hypothetical protein